MKSLQYKHLEPACLREWCSRAVSGRCRAYVRHRWSYQHAGIESRDNSRHEFIRCDDPFGSQLLELSLRWTPALDCSCRLLLHLLRRCQTGRLSIYAALLTVATARHSYPRCRRRKFQLTRLETRTKESTHMREYMYMIFMCEVNVTVVIFAATVDFYLRREV